MLKTSPQAIFQEIAAGERNRKAVCAAKKKMVDSYSGPYFNEKKALDEEEIQPSRQLGKPGSELQVLVSRLPQKRSGAGEQLAPCVIELEANLSSCIHAEPQDTKHIQNESFDL